MANRGTMVMRAGFNANAKGPALEMQYTIITEDYKFVTMDGKKLAEAIKSGKAAINNMAVTDKGLVSTNGAIDNYPYMDITTRQMQNRRAVILERIEVNGNLTGYTVFTAEGALARLSVKDTVALEKTTGIANGKIRHTDSGDTISAIGGNYPLAEIKYVKKLDATTDEAKAVVVNPEVGVTFFSSAIGPKDGLMVKYAGLMVQSDDAVVMAKTYDELKEDNKRVVEKVRDISHNAAEVESLKMIRTSNAGFYGVFSLETVLKLIKAHGKLVCEMEDLGISCLDYTDGKAVESYIVLNKKLAPTGEKVMGSDKGSKALRDYSGEVMKALAAIK